MSIDPVTDAQTLLKQSEDPDGWNNFIYYGDRDLARTWAIVGPHRNRDSDVLTESNWHCILEDLRREFPDTEGESWEIFGASHWAVGWTESVMCQIFSDKFLFDGDGNPDWDYVIEDDLNPVYLWLWEVLSSLEGYPIYDESDFSEREYEDAIDSIQYVVASWVDLSDDNSYAIGSYLADEGYYIECDSIDQDAVHAAALHLGFVEEDPDYIADALDWWSANSDLVGMTPQTFALRWALGLMGQMELWDE